MIRQQVNLYQDSLKQKPRSMGFFVGIAVVFAFFIGFSLINVYLIQNLHNDSRVVEQKREALDAEQAKIKLLESTMPKQELEPSLVTELAVWQKKLDDTNKTLAILSNHDTARSQGFSAYFQALANQSISDVWLTVIHFDVEQQRINLEGSTFKSDKIPYFLQQLQKEAVFQGRTFAQLQIEKSVQVPNLMNFKLSTHLEAAKKDHVE
jgi:Tfp pilus assembly protein PilN